MIRIKDLSFRYAEGTRMALEHIDLTIDNGDFVGVIGNSGAGKTTLTYALSGAVPHHFRGDFYGGVEVDGLDTVDSTPEAISLRLGSVFQDVDAQILSSVVEDELLFGLLNFGIPREEMEPRINQALEQVGISDLRQRNIATLSGGQKQRVAIASILALRPDIIVLDEPTGELDPCCSRQIFELLRQLNEEFGVTVVVVEQKIMLLCEFCRHLVVMDQGRISLCGTVREVLAQGAKMAAIGVNIPRVVSLKNELADRGLYSGETPLNIPEAKIMVEKVLA